MAFIIPTTQQIKDQSKANYEAELNQTAPPVDKSYLNVQAAIDALNITPLYKFAADAVIQNLALTATSESLDLLGREYGIIRKPSEAAILDISLPATNGTVIQASNSFVGNSNGERYFPDSSVTAAADSADLTVTAENVGVAGNLNVSEEMTISTQVPGAETTATITAIVNTGAEKETDDVYRIRILDEIRSQGGGGNTADYRRWAQEVAGVTRAYPYSGNPTDLAENDGSSFPSQRTIYIQADTSIDIDGIAPQSLLDEVRESITANPDTGVARQPLGLTDETLFVESIIRTSFFTEIRGLDVSVDQEAQVISDIDSALTLYFAGLTPFVDGLDPVFTRNDLITDLTVSDIVQDVLSAAGGSATGVGFGIAPDTFLPSYRLSPGELAKNGGVTYA